MRLPGDLHTEGTKCHVLSCRASTAVQRSTTCHFLVLFVAGILGADRDGPPGAGLHRRGSLQGGREGFPGRAVPRAGQAPLLGPALCRRGPRRRQRQPGHCRCLGVFVSEAAPQGTPRA